LLDKLKISQKVYALALPQLILMLVMGFVSLSQMSKIGVELMDIAEVDIPLTNAITKITEQQLHQAILIERLLFKAALSKSGEMNADDEALKLTKEVESASSEISTKIKSATAFAKTSLNKLHNEEAKNKFNEVIRNLQSIDKKYEEVTLLIAKLSLATNTHDFNIIVEVSHILEAKEDKLEHALVELLNDIEQFTLNSALKAEQDEQQAIKWIWIVFIIALSFGISVPYFIARSISQPVINLSERLNEIASGDGDLTVRLNADSKDETGDVARAFNTFMIKLRELISGTSTQADSLGESAEVALSVMQITLKNVEQQRQETELVATAMNEMSATIQEVARNANSASQVTDVVSSNVVEGRAESLETQSIMTQLTSEVEEASTVIQTLVTETNKIGSVLDTIQGIAEQTNLLALNAAIEAARAGESGRGFAVVADEVRSLAQRTQKSTVDIQELVTRLQNEANNAVRSMDKGSDSAQRCLIKATATAQTFEKASEAVGEISDLNAQIASAAEQQSHVAREINDNLIRIKEVAETTSEGAKETERVNQQIATSLIDLHTSLNVFQT
jgi:methyl-accepting chemotaxis protein